MSPGVREKIPKCKVSQMALTAVSAHKRGPVYHWLISPLGSVAECLVQSELGVIAGAHPKERGCRCAPRVHEHESLAVVAPPHERGHAWNAITGLVSLAYPRRSTK